MLNGSSALESAIEFLRTDVRPQAEAIDQDPHALGAALGAMGRRNLLALKRPAEYGGPAMDEADFRAFQEESARASGALAFLQTQHQSSVSFISSSTNEDLKADYLPKMGNGERLVGIGFSQLRRSGPPVMRAARVAGGYQLDGNVPWVTGWSFYPEFMVGASLPGGESVFAIMPLTSQAGISVSPPMELAAMGTAMTVSVDIADYFVPDSRVLFERPKEWIQRNDMINVAMNVNFSAGCAMASLDILDAIALRRPNTKVPIAAERLRAELAAWRSEAAVATIADNELTTEHRHEIRAWSIDLAFRCAQAAIIASSGAANMLSNPAQRCYREALVYAVSAQTPGIMDASLTRLLR